MSNVKNVNITYPDGYPPTPKQLAFHQDDQSIVKLIEGGFASGKSYALVMETIVNLLMYPGNEVAYGRLTLDEINRTFFNIWDDLIPPELVISHNKSLRKIQVLTTGEPSTLYYIPLDDAKGAKHKLKSMNLGFAAIDQAEEISEDIIDAFRGRLRRKGTRRQLAMNANPEGHNWLWRRFIKEKDQHRKHSLYVMNPWTEGAPEPTEEEFLKWKDELGIKKDLRDCVISDFPDLLQYTDNPYLPIDYLLDMFSWSENLKRRYVYGKHDAFEGLIYPEFDERVHVIPPFDTQGKDFVRVISLDWGKVNPTAVYFWDIGPDGTVFCTNEIYQTGVDVMTLKLMIRAMNRDKKVAAYVADPSINRKNSVDTSSVHDMFRRQDDGAGWAITWRDADNSMGAVNSGIEVVRSYLKNDPFTDKLSKVFFFKGKCPNLVEEIMDYRWKEMAQTMTLEKAKNQPEVPRKFKDHAMDSMRYALSFIHRNNIKPNVAEKNMRKFLRQYWARERQLTSERTWMTA